MPKRGYLLTTEPLSSDEASQAKPNQILNTNSCRPSGDEMFLELEKIADEKGIRVQTLLRAVVIPEWVQNEGLSMNPRLNPTRGQTSNRERRGERSLKEF